MSTILVVDDSEFMRRKLVRIIKSQGHEIVEAATGQEGLRLISECHPDCVVLDLLMPGLGGLGMLKTLRDQNSDLQVIVMTADIQEATREKCAALGAAAVLNKPPQATELHLALRGVLAERQNRCP